MGEGRRALAWPQASAATEARRSQAGLGAEGRRGGEAAAESSGGGGNRGGNPGANRSRPG